MHWKKISEHVPGRSDVQCLHRWQKVLNPKLLKGPWTKEVRLFPILRLLIYICPYLLHSHKMLGKPDIMDGKVRQTCLSFCALVIHTLLSLPAKSVSNAISFVLQRISVFLGSCRRMTRFANSSLNTDPESGPSLPPNSTVESESNAEKGTTLKSLGIQSENTASKPVRKRKEKTDFFFCFSILTLQ